MKTIKELNKIAEDKYGIEEGLWFTFNDPDLEDEFTQGEALPINVYDGNTICL